MSLYEFEISIRSAQMVRVRSLEIQLLPVEVEASRSEYRGTTHKGSAGAPEKVDIAFSMIFAIGSQK